MLSLEYYEISGKLKTEDDYTASGITLTENGNFIELNEHGELSPYAGEGGELNFIQEMVGLKQEEEVDEDFYCKPVMTNLEDDTVIVAKALNIRGEEVDWEFVLQVGGEIEMHRSKVTQIINTYAKEFSFEDMELLKKALFILGYTEHMALGTDAKVIINETIELAKRFGSADTFKLVNSVFHQLLMEHEGSEAGS